MGKYNFDLPTHRRDTNSLKWDICTDPKMLPLWVADMDFQVLPEITSALQKRVSEGIFGYTKVPKSYYDAIIRWFSDRHGLMLEPEWILYTIGVVPAVSCAIKAMTLPGEKVLVQTPVYNAFFSSITNNGCLIEESPLKRKGDSYEIDFDDFERKCADPKTTVFLLCNPHNPGGRVWTPDELEHINAICLKHHVRVISDEIHNEIVMPGYHYTPFASASDACLNNSVTMTSSSKSFNVAGLQIANIFCNNIVLRRRIDRAININEVCDVNPFGVIALQEAYNHGAEWIDELNEYIYGNYKALKEYLSHEVPEVKVLKLEGTYLAWLDIKALNTKSDALEKDLERNGKVMLNSGTMYGCTAGEGYIRVNMATQRATLMEGMRRAAIVMQKYRQ